MPTPEEELRKHQDEIFRRLSDLQGFYTNNPFAQQLQQQIGARASGAESPYGPSVLAGLHGQNADAGAGQFNNQREILLRAFANAGMGGSGIEASAMANAAQQANALTRRNRIDITSRADLANFQARERAQSEAQGFLGMQAQHAQQATAQEVGARSQIHATSDGSTPMNVGGPAAADPRIEQQRQNFLGQNPFLRQLSGVMDPVMGQGHFQRGAMPFTTSSAAQAYGAQFAAAQANTQHQRNALQAQADSWEANKAMFFAQHGM